MYNETCELCKTTGHEYLIDDKCFSCIEKELERLERQLAVKDKLIETLAVFAGEYQKTCIGHASESHHKGNRANKEFWENQVKMVDCTLKALSEKGKTNG